MKLRLLFEMCCLGVLCNLQHAEAADPVFGVHVGSWHSEPGFNNFNPGVYARTAGGLVIGTYRNSLRKQTVYAGLHLDSETLPVGITVGLASGYQRSVVMPIVAPSLRIGSARILFAPKVRGVNDALAIHFAYEIPLAVRVTRFVRVSPSRVS